MTEAGQPSGIASPRARGQGEEGTAPGAAAQEEGAGTGATCRRQPQPDFGSMRAAPRRDPPVPRCRCSSSAVRGHPGVGTALGTARKDFVPGGAATGAGICATPGQTPSPAVVFAEEPWSRELPLWGRAAGEGGSYPCAARRFPRKNGAFMSPTLPLPRMGLGGCPRGWVSADKKGIVSLRAGFLAAPAPRRGSPQWLAFLRNCCRGANYPPLLITDAK